MDAALAIPLLEWAAQSSRHDRREAYGWEESDSGLEANLAAESAPGADRTLAALRSECRASKKDDEGR